MWVSFLYTTTLFLPTLGVSFKFDTHFNKLKEKVMEKDSEMQTLRLCISFIIKFEWKMVSGVCGLLPFIEYSNWDF